MYITGLWKCITIIIITTYITYTTYITCITTCLAFDHWQVPYKEVFAWGALEHREGREMYSSNNKSVFFSYHQWHWCKLFNVWVATVFASCIYVRYPLLCVLTSQKFLSKITVSLLLLNPLSILSHRQIFLLISYSPFSPEKKIFKHMLLNGAELSGNGKGWLFPCLVQSHLSTMYVNEIQNIASELQGTWLKMSYNEKPPSVILWWAVIIGYGSVSSWAAPKATAIRADINHFRTYKTTVHLFFFFLHTYVN